jgi:hypothetical protein
MPCQLASTADQRSLPHYPGAVTAVQQPPLLQTAPHIRYCPTALQFFPASAAAHSLLTAASPAQHHHNAATLHVSNACSPALHCTAVQQRRNLQQHQQPLTCAAPTRCPLCYRCYS